MAHDDFPVRTQGVRPPQPLTRDHVIATAMRLVDRDGSAGLTMRGLAAELGVSKTAVTWHVGDRSRLLAQIGATWLGTIAPPAGGDDWIGWLGDLARAYRSVALRHPHLARLTIDGFSAVSVAGSLAVPEAIVSRLARSGLPDRELAHAYNAILSATLGFVALELAGGPTAPIRADLGAVDAERAPAIARHLDQLGDRSFGLAPTADRFDDSFDYLIDLITDGLRHRTSRRRAAAAR